MKWFLRFLKSIPKGISSKLRYYGGLAGLIVFSFRDYLTDRKGRKRVNQILLMQVYFTGNFALKIVGMVAFALGAITILQLFTQLSKFGALDYVGKILNLVIIRELGPIITAFIVIARSGSAIAADIGTMMVNDEINAMEMLGINTLKFVVFPRIAGMIIANILLTVYFDAIGLIGGFIVGNLTAGITFDMFSNYVMNSITIMDMFSSLIKSMVFGVFIATISIFHGFQAVVSTQIPQVTTKAVVSSISALFFLDVIVTVIFYL
jgi:phospholipid/cholesterol/gamma-HCH transport system permease protein